MISVRKKDVAMLLSGLQYASAGKPGLEQYQTPSEIAADVMWVAFLAGDVEGRRVADLGCGNGVLGCGALLLGAMHVFFVDVDEAMLDMAKKNVQLLEKKTGKVFPCSFIWQPVTQFRERVDTVVQNPPFGVQKEHADRDFLLGAMKARVAYSFHKLETRAFIERFVVGHGKRALLLRQFSFPLKKTMRFHSKNVHKVDVGVWKII